MVPEWGARSQSSVRSVAATEDCTYLPLEKGHTNKK